MKFFLAFLIFVPAATVAQKQYKLTPFQSNLEKCFGDKIDFRKIDSSQKLYKSLSQNFSLQTSETVFREVKYMQKGVLLKLKYEEGVIRIYSIDDEDNLELISTEKFEAKAGTYGMRHKILTPESKISQLLFQANILEDFQKLKEGRAKQLQLDITMADNQIKTLDIELVAEKKSLKCIRKESSDICSCTI